MFRGFKGSYEFENSSLHNGTSLKDHVLVSAIFQYPKIDFLNFQTKIGYIDDHKSEIFFIILIIFTHFKGAILGCF